MHLRQKVIHSLYRQERFECLSKLCEFGNLKDKRELRIVGLIMTWTEMNDITIPPKSNAFDSWPVDSVVHKDRHVVECFFQKLKWFHRVFTRYD